MIGKNEVESHAGEAVQGSALLVGVYRVMHSLWKVVC